MFFYLLIPYFVRMDIIKAIQMDKIKLKKRGPEQIYHFDTYPLGHEIKIIPLKQSSFKSMLSKFNRNLAKDDRHKYGYEQQKNFIIAKREQ